MIRILYFIIMYFIVWQCMQRLEIIRLTKQITSIQFKKIINIFFKHWIIVIQFCKIEYLTIIQIARIVYFVKNMYANIRLS